jgi:Uncharacterized protein conserved in bacteria
MNARTLITSTLLALSFTPVPALSQSEGGDQFLDGIGETALVSRYILRDNTQDRSRNSRHATMRGGTAMFVDDAKFGKVLSLSDGRYFQLPGEALEGVDTVSVAGWVLLKSDEPWQRFFDFGKDTTANFFCTPIGEGGSEGYRARITTAGWEQEHGPIATQISTNVWTHLAVVLDSARKTLTTYRDGKRVAQATDVPISLEQVLDQENGSANHIYIGKSQYDNDATLVAELHDIRIYSIALSEQQVSTIYSNALTGQTSTSRSAADSKAVGASAIATAFGLTGVPDISVETEQGQLPKLPILIAGVYRDGRAGPPVRVLWPAPTNNVQVLEPGSYVITGRVAGTEFQPKATVTVKKAETTSAGPKRSLEAFPLDAVTLELDTQQRPTPFMKNRDKFMRGLAESNPDRFLYMFRNTFGQPQPQGAEPLRGWDTQTTRLRGHATGHYLSALAQAYASSVYDQTLRSNLLHKMNYMIETLYDLSRKSGNPTNEGAPFVADPTAVPPGPGKSGYDSDLTERGIRTDYWNWGKGFISAYPPDQFIMLEKGATYGTHNDQIWAPYYTLHKILAGLMDCYEVGGNKKALIIAQDMGLWVHERLKVLPPETRISMWNRYIAGEYGGMNEAMARLSRMTNDKRFLECAKLFDNISFFFGDSRHTHGLACNVDTLRGKHANQHIPQITGALETYRNTQELPYFRIAENFWDLCTGCYMYSIGGVAGAKNPNNAECFTAQPNTIFANGFANGGQNETCATYNLLKLSRELFLFKQEPRYMDYYEQALYNHILASVAENNAGNTYHVPLNPGVRKQFGNPRMDGFTCCNGTAIESNTKLQDSIYFRSADGNALFVNLYVPSKLNWKEKGVAIKQETSFPYGDSTKLTVNGSGDFEIHLRVPSWATRGFTAKINGESQNLNATPGSYVTLRRNWKNNDVIELQLPFSFRLFPVMDQPNIASLFYGPVLLAAQESEQLSTWRKVQLNLLEPDKSITGDPSTLRFTLGELSLKPFYESYERYSVYFDVSGN